jgi:hypothetical protein
LSIARACISGGSLGRGRSGSTSVMAPKLPGAPTFGKYFMAQS